MPSWQMQWLQTVVLSPQESNLQLHRAQAIFMATLCTVVMPPSNNPLSAPSMHQLQPDVLHMTIDARWHSSSPWRPWLITNRSKLYREARSIDRLAQLSPKSTPIMLTINTTECIRLYYNLRTLLCQCKKNPLLIHHRSQSSLKSQLLKSQICQLFRALEGCLSKASSTRVIDMYRGINSVTLCRRFLTELSPILSRWPHMPTRLPAAKKATI